MFKKAVFKGLRGFKFSEKISIFKKKTIEEVTHIQPQGKSIEAFKGKPLSIEEISDFDLYYQDFSFRASKRLESNYKKFNNKLKTEIFEVLEGKLGNTPEKIAYFLENRLKNLTEIEVLYCLRRISELKNINDFKLIHTGLYLQLIERMKGFEYLDSSVIKGFLSLIREFSIEDRDLLTLILDGLTRIIKIVEEKPIKIEEKNDIIDCFILMIGIFKRETAQDNEKIIKILAYIMKNDQSIEVERWKTLFFELSRNEIIISPNYLSDFDKIFTEKRASFSTSEAVETLYLMAKNRFQTPSFLLFFTEQKGLKSWFLSLSSQEMSSFIWSLSLLDHSLISKEFNFQEIEETILEILAQNPQKLQKKDNRTIIQSFHHIAKASKKFWFFFDSLKRLALLGLSIQELFTILINQMKFNVFNMELIEFFFRQFDSDFSFEFIQELAPQQVIEMFQVATLGFHKIARNARKQENQKGLRFLVRMGELSEEICERLFGEKAVYRTLSLKETILLYKLFNITYLMLNKNGVSTEEEFLDSMQTLSKRILRKSDEISPEDYVKLVVLLDILLNSEEDISLSLLAKLEERMNEIIVKKPEELVSLTKLFGKNEVSRKRLWAALQISLIENLESLKLEEIFIVAGVFEKLEKDRVLPKNKGFWDYVTSVFNQSEFHFALAKILFRKVEDRDLFKKSLLERSGVSQEIMKQIEETEIEDSDSESESKDKEDKSRTENINQLL